MSSKSDFDINSYLGYISSLPPGAQLPYAFDPSQSAEDYFASTLQAQGAPSVILTGSAGLTAGVPYNGLNPELVAQVSTVSLMTTLNNLDGSFVYTGTPNIPGPQTIDNAIIQVHALSGTNSLVSKNPLLAEVLTEMYSINNPKPTNPIALGFWNVGRNAFLAQPLDHLFENDLGQIKNLYDQIAGNNLAGSLFSPASGWVTNSSSLAEDIARYKILYTFNLLYRLSNGGLTNPNSWAPSNLSSPVLIAPPATFQGFLQFLTSNSVTGSDGTNRTINNPMGQIGTTTATLGGPTSGPPVTTLQEAIGGSTTDEVSSSLLTQYIQSYPETESAEPGPFFSNFLVGLNNSTVGVNYTDVQSYYVVPGVTYLNTPYASQSNPAIGSFVSLLGNLNPTDFSTFSGTFVNTLLTKMINEFSNTLQLSSDWDQILSSDPTVRNEEIVELFTQTFSSFIKYLSNNNALTGSASFDFFTSWQLYLAPTLLLGAGVGGTSGPVNAFTFQDLYNSFFPTPPSDPNAAFIPLLTAFMKKQIAAGNVGVPGQLASEWGFVVTSEWLRSKGLPSTQDLDPFKGANFDLVDILTELYSLLSDLLGQMQKMAAAQANYQLFLANYQQDYTNFIASVPTITAAGSSPLQDEDVNSSRLTSLRQDMANVGAQSLTSSRGYSSIVQNTQTQVTTNISQTNQAVNTQANLSQTLLQEFQSILGSIWR